MSPSTSSQFQLNPNKKRKKKKGKKREERKRNFEGTYLLGPEDNTSARLITKPVSHTRKLTLWTTEEPFSHLGLTYRPRNCCLSLSLSLFLLALFFSLRCAQRWRLLYITFVSPDFQFVCRNLSIWCFSPSDC